MRTPADSSAGSPERRTTARGGASDTRRWTGSGATAAVVGAELVPILLAEVPLLVELGCVLDLGLGQVDVDRLGVGIDLADHAGRKHHLLAEDPGPVSTTTKLPPAS